MHLMIVGIIMVQRILWKGGLKMKFEPIEIKDKNNRTIVLRNATPDDAEDLITYLKVTTAETLGTGRSCHDTGAGDSVY